MVWHILITKPKLGSMEVLELRHRGTNVKNYSNLAAEHSVGWVFEES
jgi:hypothetical protein